MYFKLPELPFTTEQVSKWLSAETLEFHYGKHHSAYVDKLNKLVPGSGFENANLETIVKRAEGALFNSAAQAWNHTFYWLGINPNPGNESFETLPELENMLVDSFGSVEIFSKKFSESANGFFGAGWVWLVFNDLTRKLEIVQTSNAGNPIKEELIPLLTCDVWEHAYYIDYRNARSKYVDGFMKAINWTFVNENLLKKGIPDLTSIMRIADAPIALDPKRLATWENEGGAL